MLPQNMMRYMILQYFIWFYIEYTRILKGISICSNVSRGKQKRRLSCTYIFDLSIPELGWVRMMRQLKCEYCADLCRLWPV